jgi:hypothetical protein
MPIHDQKKEGYIMRIKALLCLMIVLLAVVPVLGQDTAWSAYVYNGRDLVRVFSDGRQETYNLGLPENTFMGSREMSFSADGSRVAYCAVTYDQTVTDPALQTSAVLVLRDIAAQTNLLEIDMGHPVACRTGQEAFKPDESLLAVALINYIPGSPGVDESLPSRQLLMIDSATGDVVYELDDQSEYEVLGVTFPGPTLSLVKYVGTDYVIYAPVPYFTEGYPDTAYRWHLDTGTIEPETGEQWEQFLEDTLDATGEKVWITTDPNLPSVQPIGPSLPLNVVRVADSAGQVSTILHVGDQTPGEVHFINNGQQIAVMLMPVFDETQPDTPIEYRWIALDRAGTVTDLVTDLNYSNLDGAPDGYVRIINDLSDVNNSTFSLEYTSNGQTTQLWTTTGPRSDPYGAWELAWVTPMPAAEGLPPFTPIS